MRGGGRDFFHPKIFFMEGDAMGGSYIFFPFLMKVGHGMAAHTYFLQLMKMGHGMAAHTYFLHLMKVGHGMSAHAYFFFYIS